eukprot:3233712-Prymnesium_polylepis.1
MCVLRWPPEQQKKSARRAPTPARTPMRADTQCAPAPAGVARRGACHHLQSSCAARTCILSTSVSSVSRPPVVSSLSATVSPVVWRFRPTDGFVDSGQIWQLPNLGPLVTADRFTLPQ